MLLPKPRGELSAALVEHLRAVPAATTFPDARPDDEADAALTLWVLHELSFQGFEDVVEDDGHDAEWDPALAPLRHRLERDLETRLRARWDDARDRAPERTDDLGADLFAFVEAFEGPSVAAFVQREADRDQVLDLLKLRSVFHLKESDPTAFSVPRLPVVAKAALSELQYDEYGSGDPNRLHSHLFARGLEQVGLRPDYGAYVDDASPEVLEMNNALSMFGLHRRLRGASVGHLAAFEATSSMPSRRMAQGLRRLELSEEMAAYYDEHVVADAVHDQLAVRMICGGLVDQEPQLADDVFLGAFTCLDTEARFARAVLESWGAAA